MRKFPHVTWVLTLLAMAVLATPTALLAKNKKVKEAKADSHNFFDFQEAHYFTSPDQRVGAKILIDSTKVGPTLVSMQHLTFLPTAHIKSHRHVYVTEVVYVLKGNLVLRIGEQIKVMGPDTTAYIPPQTFHEYKNDSGDVCQFLQFFSPSGPEEEYRNWATPTKIATGSAATPTPPPATGPIIIQVPTPQIIPGSPRPVIGGVKRVESAQTKDLELKSDPQTTEPVLSPPVEPVVPATPVTPPPAVTPSPAPTATPTIKISPRFGSLKPKETK